jgi:hypothetical protein
MRTWPTPVLLLLLAACDDPPPTAICLYDTASCSYGKQGGACPPALTDYTTRCLDLPGPDCPSPASDSQVDGASGQVHVTYTANPREVDGVTCDDYAADPSLDPEPHVTTCASERDGTCDAPGKCPDGTDQDDCAGQPCPLVPPDELDCATSVRGILWCTNYAGGSRCAADGALYVCDGDMWQQANIIDIDDICHSIGSIGYYGCSGAFSEFLGYCM